MLGLGELEAQEITINACRSGRVAAWYLDDTKEACIYIDNLEALTPEEIASELL